MLNQFKVRESGLTVNTEDILRFSHLFEDQVTLESLDQKYLKALCKLLDIPTIGPAALLRFQLEMKVRQLKVDDQVYILLIIYIILICHFGCNLKPPYQIKLIIQI